MKVKQFLLSILGILMVAVSVFVYITAIVFAVAEKLLGELSALSGKAKVYITRGTQWLGNTGIGLVRGDD